MSEMVRYGGRIGTVVWEYSDGDVRVLFDDGIERDCDADYCEAVEETPLSECTADELAELWTSGQLKVIDCDSCSSNAEQTEGLT